MENNDSMDIPHVGLEESLIMDTCDSRDNANKVRSSNDSFSSFLSSAASSWALHNDNKQEEEQPQQRSPYMYDSHTTELQVETESECAPFFVDIKEKLSKNEIQHLRNIGLLPSMTEKGAVNDFDDAKLQQFLGESNISIIHEDNDENDKAKEKEEESYNICLMKEKHIDYLSRALMTFGSHKPLSASYVSLDASRPWIMYWTLHSLDLLDALPTLPEQALLGILTTLEKCWKEVNITIEENDFSPPLSPLKVSKRVFVGGGFGGGPGQMPHCATTYAAVLALSILAGYKNKINDETQSDISKKALQILRSKRSALYVWFWSLRNSSKNGGFHMHHDGEVDVRAAFTIACMATLLNIATDSLFQNTLQYIQSCQTYEGGFGGEPDAEAHGGYTFCALAAYHFLYQQQSTHSTHIDYASLQGWLARRQMAFEGGFSGRGNKLVDGCYSFWQGASLALLDTMQSYLNSQLADTYNVWDSGIYSSEVCSFGVTRIYGNPPTNEYNSANKPELLTFDSLKLQRYILLCAQDINGGLRDKPSKPRDFYHSCYNLSGLSVAQHVLSSPPINYGHSKLAIVKPTHVAFNIRIDRVQSILHAFHANKNNNTEE